jgi:amidase
VKIPFIGQADLSRLADVLGLEIAREEVAEFLEVAEFIRAGLIAANGSEDLKAGVTQAGARGRSINRNERSDPYNAVISWCSLEGWSDGVLAGRSFGVKDNMAVAGVPTTCGFDLINHIPARSATVVDRILAAGGRVIAKLNMDAFAWSGGGDTSSFGRVRNPVNTEWSAGGSSGGSAAALYLPQIDITLGTDQGGSIRVPASWCGVLGMKPTYGLVPYTGILGMEASVDHVGPLARHVADLGAALTVIAGPDGDDPRQSPPRSGEDYNDAIVEAPKNLAGITLGVLEEGFHLDDDAPTGTEQTNEATRAALDELRALGAEVRSISIPKHRSAPAYLFVMLMESLAASFDSPTAGYGHRGSQDWELDIARTAAMRAAGTVLPATTRIAALMGAHLRAEYSGAAYSWVRSRAQRLTTDFDAALADADFIVMPTATHYAHAFRDDLNLSKTVMRGWDMFANTISTNISGHPAISLPMARAGPHPVGVMFIAQRGGDAALLRLAATIERKVGWFPPQGTDP